MKPTERRSSGIHEAASHGAGIARLNEMHMAGVYFNEGLQHGQQVRRRAGDRLFKRTPKDRELHRGRAFHLFELVRGRSYFELASLILRLRIDDLRCGANGR
ncbi:MAG: hypothetical protein AB7U61_12420, partial [Methylocystis sp.]